MRRLWILLSLIVGMSFPIGIAVAGLTPCTGRLINPVTDICWDCLLPITIGSTPFYDGYESRHGQSSRYFLYLWRGFIS